VQNYQTGPGAEQRLALSKFANAFGGSPALVASINRGDPAAAQEVQKLQARTAMQDLTQAVDGGRINKTEYQAFLQNNPGIETLPDATERIYNFASRQAQLGFAKQQAASAYYADPKNDPAQFEPQYSALLNKLGIGAPSISTGNAKGSTAPTTAAVLPRTNPQGWILNSNPTTRRRSRQRSTRRMRNRSISNATRTGSAMT
jgi:hypothetical protein